ncbi:radical SAM protein [Thermopirellula anaerolimosa]
MSDPSLAPLVFRHHPRRFGDWKYVYPVVSRRAGGVSLGVNLNLDKVCNFDCVYCQVDRREMGEREFLDLRQLDEELRQAVPWIVSGEIFRDPAFAETPAQFRRFQDIAFSGDGEPTTYRNFPQVIETTAAVRRELAPPDLKLVLITNASMFHRPAVREGLALLDANGGEIWAKLDAGTEAYFRRIARTSISFGQILENITEAARARPIVIQTLLMRWGEEPLDDAERAAYCARLREVLEAGGSLRRVQLYTVARKPAESFARPLSAEELETWAEAVRREVGVPVAVYP